MVDCSPVVAELWFGASRSIQPPIERAIVANFLAPYRCLPFDRQSAEYYGTIKASLESMGFSISDFDASIAAIALQYGLRIVTHNIRDFARVPGLNLVDWEVP
jgi:tRNA(fMet)-specific endonuclease VapC